MTYFHYNYSNNNTYVYCLWLNLFCQKNIIDASKKSAQLDLWLPWIFSRNRNKYKLIIYKNYIVKISIIIFY